MLARTRGRPPVEDPKSGAFSMRLQMSILERVDAAAEAAGQNRSQWLAEAALEKLNRPRTPAGGLATAIAMTIDRIERDYGASWRAPYVAQMVVAAVTTVIEHFRVDGAIVPPPRIPTDIKEMPPEMAGNPALLGGIEGGKTIAILQWSQTDLAGNPLPGSVLEALRGR